MGIMIQNKVACFCGPPCSFMQCNLGQFLQRFGVADGAK